MSWKKSKTYVTNISPKEREENKVQSPEWNHINPFQINVHILYKSDQNPNKTLKIWPSDYFKYI